MSPRPWQGAALSGADYSAAELSGDDVTLFVLDQRRLPAEEIYVRCVGVIDVADAIRDMVVRGAPAIGITAAYGMALAARAARVEPAAGYRTAMRVAGEALVVTRPTAVNLAWAVGRCLDLAHRHALADGDARASEMAALARNIHREDVAACRTLGRIGAERLPAGVRVLTHCNAGALATGGYGTALGVVRAAHACGKLEQVYADETRPYLQGARLTAWELVRDRIPVTVLGDAMAAYCMRRGFVDAVVVGADRIARNGDVANKVGTYALACLARRHDLPFYVAAPWSSVDLATPSEAGIEIEERPRDELARFADRVIVPHGASVYNVGFDVTPADLVTAIVTERGVFAPGDLAAACGER
jgi:methylthioribose-1-phosphate isomerase